MYLGENMKSIETLLELAWAIAMAFLIVYTAWVLNSILLFAITDFNISELTHLISLGLIDCLTI